MRSERAGAVPHRWWRTGRIGRGAGAAVAVLTVLGGAAGAGPVEPAGPAPATPAGTVLEVSRSSCGQGWRHPRAGTQTVYLSNTGSLTAEADLIDPDTGAIYAEVEGLAPGTGRPLRVTLGPGRYALRCLPEDTDAIVGPTVTLPGSGPRPAGIRPVTQADLVAPVKQYRAAVAGGLATLVTQAAALDQAVRDGDRARAENAWLTAHLSYERLGAAYGTFGDYDAKINGRPAGPPGGVSDAGFTGFHRIEYGLWHGEPMDALAGPTGQLVADVTGLQDDFPAEQTDPRDLGLRAHEILEDTLQDELTGASDQGSGSTLATARANLDGTRMVLAALRPVLTGRYPGLSGVDRGLDRLQRLLDAAQRPDGSWTPVGQLGHDQRQRLNGAAGDLLERLAPVAVICDPRRT